MFLSKADFGDDDDGLPPAKPAPSQQQPNAFATPVKAPAPTSASVGSTASTVAGADASPIVVASPAIHRQRMAEQKQKALDKRKSKNFVGGLVRTNEDGVAAAGPRPTTPSAKVVVGAAGASAAAAGGGTPAKAAAGGGMTFTPSNTAQVEGATSGAGGGSVVADMLREREREREHKGISQVEKSMLAMGISPVFDPTKKSGAGGAGGVGGAAGYGNTAAGGGMLTDVKLDFSDMRSFLMAPVAKGVMMQCYIVRNKKGLKNKMYPSYELYLETHKDPSTGEAKFLLASKKQSQNKTSYYLVSMDKGALTKESASFMGKVRSNFMGTEFTLYDKGVSPKKVDDDQLAISLMTVRQELGFVVYESNLLGARGPRKMTVALPAVGKDGSRAVWRPLKESDSMGVKFKAANAAIQQQQQHQAAAQAAAGPSGAPVAPQQHSPTASAAAAAGAGAAASGGVPGGAKDASDLMKLENKQPKWNDQVGAFVLNFNGRVTMASVKNFQLVNVEDPSESVLLQFGRVEKDKFTMDFQYPLSPFQAFCICLSSFDYKIACE